MSSCSEIMEQFCLCLATRTPWHARSTQTRTLAPHSLPDETTHRQRRRLDLGGGWRGTLAIHLISIAGKSSSHGKNKNTFHWCNQKNIDLIGT